MTIGGRGVAGGIGVASPEKSKSVEAVPPDLLLVIRNSGVLTDRQMVDVRARVASGEYPAEPKELAARLVREELLTEYQTRRLLQGKFHHLTIGKYAILDRLGAGSMGRVYKAHHQLMGRVVALKVIAPEIVANERAVSRFNREMKLVGRLDHPNVVRAYDADQTNGMLYIVMEYVVGQSLGQLLKEGKLSPVDAVSFAAQAALGLDHAHKQGIVHRDVKPSNLLVSDIKEIKVLDLGLGVLMDSDAQATFATADGITVGTVDYMSPEQACGREVDGRSDIFGLGCTLYHMVSGHQAFPGKSPIERLGNRINGAHVPITEHRPDLPPAVVAVIDKMLANSPSDRYQTAGAAAEALQALIRPRGKPAARVRPSAPPPRVEVASPEVVEVHPAYPRWFDPLARLAEDRPVLALIVVLVILTAALGLGVLLGIAL